MSDPSHVFKALADGTRWRMLSVLRKHELNVGELVEVLHQPQSTVSRHLRVLRDAGLIRDTRQGNTVHYSVSESNNGSELPGRVLDLVNSEPLPEELERRIALVLSKRRAVSDRFFQDVGGRWDRLREEAFGRRFELESFLRLLPPSWTVVDVGSGTGHLLPCLASNFERVIGIEPVEAMLAAASDRMAAEGCSRVELIRGELDRLPLVDATADLAIAVLVLHHVPAPPDAVAELYRVLKPGGRVLIVDQEMHDSDEFRNRMQDFYWGFEPRNLAQLLENTGFVGVRAASLATVERGPDAPGLFVIDGKRPS